MTTVLNLRPVWPLAHAIGAGAPALPRPRPELPCPGKAKRTLMDANAPMKSTACICDAMISPEAQQSSSASERRCKLQVMCTVNTQCATCSAHDAISLQHAVQRMCKQPMASVIAQRSTDSTAANKRSAYARSGPQAHILMVRVVVPKVKSVGRRASSRTCRDDSNLAVPLAAQRPHPAARTMQHAACMWVRTHG